MPTYEVDVQGQTYEVDAPDSNTAWQWANYTHTQSAPAPTRPAPPVKEAGFSPTNLALESGQSLVGATKSIIEGFGAGSGPAEYLEGVSKKIGSYISPERQAEIQRRSALEKQAAASFKTVK